LMGVEPEPRSSTRGNVTHAIAAVTLVVADCDEAIAFFSDIPRFTLIEDNPLGGSKR
jgi:hypothetical protein